MLVRGRTTGRIGTIPDDQFDPRRFEKIDIGQMMGYQQPQSFAQMVGGAITSIPQALAQPFTRTAGRVGGMGESILRSLITSQAEKQLQQGNYDLAEKLGRVGGASSALTRGEKPELTDPLQIAKDSAAMLSWGIPVGRATKAFRMPVAASVGKGGAIAGAAGGFGYSPETSFEGLLGSTALGAGTGFASAKIMNKLLGGRAAQGGKEKLSDFADDSYRKSVEGMEPSGALKEGITTIGPEEPTWLQRQIKGIREGSQTKMMRKTPPAKWGGASTIRNAPETIGMRIGDKGAQTPEQVYEKAFKSMAEAGQGIDDITKELAKRGIRVDTTKTLNALDDYISKQGDMAFKQELGAMRENLVRSLEGGSVTSITRPTGGPSMADPNNFVNLKHNARNNALWKFGAGTEDKTTAAWQKVYKAMDDTIDDLARDQGIGSLKSLNRQYANAYNLAGYAAEASNVLEKSPIDYYTLISAGVGLSGGNVPGLIGNVGFTKAATSPKVQFALADLLEKFPQRGGTTMIPSAPAATAGDTPGLLSRLMGGTQKAAPYIPAASGMMMNQLLQAPKMSPGDMTQDNLLTNLMVQQGQLPQSQMEMYPQGQAPQMPSGGPLGLTAEQMQMLGTLPLKQRNKLIEDLIGSQFETESKKPEKLTDKQRSFVGAGKLGEELVNILESQPDAVFAGPISGRLSKIGELTGTESTVQTQVKAKIASARTVARNALLGANMSDREIESYLDATFDINLPKPILLNRLRTFVSDMNTMAVRDVESATSLGL